MTKAAPAKKATSLKGEKIGNQTFLIVILALGTLAFRILTLGSLAFRGGYPAVPGDVPVRMADGFLRCFVQHFPKKG